MFHDPPVPWQEFVKPVVKDSHQLKGLIRIFTGVCNGFRILRIQLIKWFSVCCLGKGLSFVTEKLRRQCLKATVLKPSERVVPVLRHLCRTDGVIHRSLDHDPEVIRKGRLERDVVTDLDYFVALQQRLMEGKPVVPVHVLSDQMP